MVVIGYVHLPWLLGMRHGGHVWVNAFDLADNESAGQGASVDKSRRATIPPLHLAKTATPPHPQPRHDNTTQTIVKKHGILILILTTGARLSCLRMPSFDRSLNYLPPLCFRFPSGDWPH